MDIHKRTQNIPLLKSLSSAEMAALIDESQFLTLRKRRDTFTIGVREKNIFIVLDGRLLLQIKASKDQSCSLEIVKTGHLVGEPFLATKQIIPQQIEPITTAELLSIPKDSFKELLQKNREVAEATTIQIAERLSRANQRIADHAFLSATQKVAKIIVHLGAGEDNFVLPVTQKELASLIGITREKTNRSIKELTESGLITQINGTYRIVDRERLSSLYKWKS